MDIGKALTFIKDDERWIEKLAIGVGVIIVSGILSIALIGFLGFFILLGYCLRLVGNVRDGDPTPLPEWNEWGEDLARGFKLSIALLVWALPALLMIVPTTIGGAIAGSGDAGDFFGTMIVLCSTCLTTLYALALVVLAPGITISFLRDDRISSGLMVGEIWSWSQANIGSLIIVALVVVAGSFVITMVASIAGLLLCLIGAVVTIPLGMLVTYLFQYHLYGQLAYAHPMYDVGRPFTPTVPADQGEISQRAVAAEFDAEPASLAVMPDETTPAATTGDADLPAAEAGSTDSTPADDTSPSV